MCEYKLMNTINKIILKECATYLYLRSNIANLFIFGTTILLIWRLAYCQKSLPLINKHFSIYDCHKMKLPAVENPHFKSR